MACDHECHERPEDTGPATIPTLTTAIASFLRSDVFLIGTLLVLAVLNFGWVIYPSLGAIWGLLNAAIITGILLAGIAVRFFRGKKHNS